MAAETAAISYRGIITASRISWAEQMINKWDPNTPRSPYAGVTSIFLESRDEARRFLFAVHDLRKEMERSSDRDDDDPDGSILRKRPLMDTAMRRLQREFAEILSSNRNASPVVTPPATDDTDTDSSTFRYYLEDYGSDGDDSFQAATLDYLRDVAECMISSGYAHDCVEIYKQSRRSVVEDGLSRLGIEHLSPSHVQKLSWESLDFRIMQWEATSRSVFGEFFAVERDLCDAVFAYSESIAGSCFAEITRDAAVQFFRFPEVVASKSKRPPEKILHYLKMYRSIRELSPEIEAAFSSKSTNVVQSQVDASLVRLAVTIRSMLAEFESAIHKDTSKSTPPDGGLHSLTQSAVNYLVPLVDYADVLAEVYADDDPLPTPVETSPKPPKVGKTKKLEPIEEGEEEEEEEGETPETEGTIGGTTATSRFAWLITILLCKIDVKAELYKEASQSYLFLANNHQYVVNKVRGSKLAQLLGSQWLSSHERNARSFARSFLRLAWKRVLEAVPGDPSELPGVEAMRERMVQFNRAFEEACKSQLGWVVLDEKVRMEIKTAIKRNLVERYRPFYERCRAELRVEEGVAAAVRFAPEDLVNHLYGLYREGWGSFDLQSYHFGSVGKRSPWRWLKKSPSFFSTEKEKENN